MLFTKGTRYTISEQVFHCFACLKKKKKKKKKKKRKKKKIHDLRKIMKRKE